MSARAALSNLLRVFVIAALAIAAVSTAWPSRTATAGATNLYVSPQGADHNNGTTLAGVSCLS
jgi:hypothetical protein